MQNKVKKFNSEMKCHRKTMPVYARILDISSEMGELAKEYLKSTKYGTTDCAVNDEFIMEYGDVLYSILSLANELGIDAENSLDLAIQKYKNRIEKKNNMGSGN